MSGLMQAIDAHGDLFLAALCVLLLVLVFMRSRR